MNTTNRVIFNTVVLYIKLILGVILGLITTRLVLDALGETDYGIYILVSGIVGMLNILNSNMSNTSMRYLAYSLGSADKVKLLKTFNTTLFLHFIIGAGVVIIMQIGGWIMFEHMLNIPLEKVSDAKIVFQFMVVTTFITVISAPYDAVMNAHENILALSLVDLLGFILKLGVAIFLLYSNANLLVLYGFSLLVIQIILRMIKQLYSRIKYDECKIRMREYTDGHLMREILSFTGWNLFGSVGAMAVTQIRSVLINIFFGVKLNAAEGIASSASAQVNMVSVSITDALNPQLIKSEGGGNRDRMLRITEQGTKFSTFLFALAAIPVMLESDYLLNLWLKDVPTFAVIFIQLSLMTMLIEKFTFQITHAIRAVGRIKAFQVTETTLRVLTIPTAYFAFKANYGPYVIYVIGIIVSSIVFISRLYFGKRIAKLNIVNYIKNGLLPIVKPLFLSLIVPLAFLNTLPEGLLRLTTVTLGFCVSLVLGFWFFGVSGEEKEKLKDVAKTFMTKTKIFLIF
jgi:O-antigen/teichoic acid export membrane protein